MVEAAAGGKRGAGGHDRDLGVEPGGQRRADVDGGLVKLRAAPVGLDPGHRVRRRVEQEGDVVGRPVEQAGGLRRLGPGDVAAAIRTTASLQLRLSQALTGRRGDVDHVRSAGHDVRRQRSPREASVGGPAALPIGSTCGSPRRPRTCGQWPGRLVDGVGGQRPSTVGVGSCVARRRPRARRRPAGPGTGSAAPRRRRRRCPPAVWASSKTTAVVRRQARCRPRPGGRRRGGC